MNRSGGHVDLVGAGPGDPGLITVLGREALARAEVIVYDHLVHPRLLDHCSALSERIFAGKSAGRCALKQDDINALLVEKAHQGLRVVRLKGGDPFVFGRGAEEAEYLAAAGVPFRVIPGVTAGVGATSFAGLAVTHRDAASAVAFVTGHVEPGRESRLDWPSLAKFPGTLVVYMGVGRLRALCQNLIDLGKPPETPAAIVQNGTLATQKTVVGTLDNLADRVEAAQLGPPAILVVGAIVGRRPTLNWFENLPLFGQTVVVTRPRDEAEAARSSLEALGAEVVLAPTVEILPPEDFGPVDQVIRRLSDYQWLVFTSGNGVRSFFDRLEQLGKDARALSSAKIAAIGPATAETLAFYRLLSDLVPEDRRSEGLAAALADQARGCRILLARADRGRALLVDQLRAVADVDVVSVYRNVDVTTLPPGLDDRVVRGEIHWITATSSAIVRRLHALLGAEARRAVGSSVRLASLSPLTTQSANQLGWSVAAEAEDATWDGVVRAILSETRGMFPPPARG